MTYDQIDFFADRFNPALTIAFIALVFLLRKPKPWELLARGIGAVLLVRVVAEIVRRSHSIPGKFPSTHCVWAFSVLTAIGMLKPKWWPFLGALGLGYGWVNVYQAYHTPWEVAGALYAIPLTIWCWRGYKAEGAAEPVSA